MASTSQDNIQLRVVVDGSPARKELAAVNQDLVKLKETQKQLVTEQRALNEARKAAKANGDTAEVQRLSKAMEENRQKLMGLNQAVTEHTTKQNALRQQIGDTALSFTELRGKAQSLQAALSRAVPDTPEARKLAAELYVLQQRMTEVGGSAGIQAQAWQHLRQGMKLTDMSMRQLALESTRLKTALDKTKPDTPEFRRLSTELSAVDSRMRVLRTGLGPFGQAWAAVKGQIMSATAILGTFFAGGAIVNMVGGMVKSSSELSDAIADVRRTTGLAQDQVQGLVQEFKTMDTRTPRAELMQLAAEAGKLGISAKDDVMAFVRAGDQLRVALGDELGGDAIKNIGKLVDLFRLKEQFGLEESMLKVGSTLNELGMSSTASEGYMVEFLKRMGGIAPLAGITIDQTLALGATLDSLGQTSEVSSTALSKMFVKMASEAQQYARIAGMSVEDFSQMMEGNALDAFIAVLNGSKKTEGGIMALTETLGDLGVDGSRAAGVFGALANNTDKLAKQLDIANAAFQEGTSVTDEFRIKNETLAAVLAKMQKEIHQTFVTTGVVDMVKEWIAQMRELMAWIRRNGEVLSAFGRVILTAGTALATYKATVLATSLATRAGMALTTAWTTLKALLTSQISRATAAQAAFNAVTKLNPIGLLVAGVTAAVMIFNRFSASVKAAADAAAQETTKLQILHQQILATNVGSEERRRLIDQLKAQYPEYLGQLDSDTATNAELAKSIALVNEMLINKAVLQAADDELTAQNAKAAEKKLALMNEERKLQELVALAVKKTGVQLKEGTALQQAQQVLMFGSVKDMGGVLASELAGSMRAVKAWEGELRNETGKSNLLLEKRNDMMKDLGMTSQESAAQQEAAVRTLAEVSAEIRSIQANIANPGEASAFTIAFWDQRLAELRAEQAALVGAAEGNAESARTLSVINEEIKRWQEEQSATSTSREEYLEIQRKIDALEKEKVAIEGTKKTREKAAQDLGPVENAMAEFHERMYQLTLNADERELRELEVKQKEELDKLIAHQEKLVKAKKLTPQDAATNVDTLKTAQTTEYSGLVEDQEWRKFDARYKVEQDIQKMLRESRSQELRDVVEHYDALIEQAQLKAQSTVQLESDRYDSVLKFREDELREVLNAEMQKWDELIRIAKAKGIDTADLETQRGRAETAIRKKWFNQQVKDSDDAEQKIRAARVQTLRHFEQMANAMAGLLQGISQYMQAGVQVAEQRADADGVRTEAEIANIQRLKEHHRDAALTALAVQGAAAIANGIASAMTLQPWPAAVAAAVSTAGIVLGLMAQARALLNQADSTSSGSQNGGARPSLNSIPLGEQGMAYMERGGTKYVFRKGTGLMTNDTGGGVLDGQYHKNGGNLLIDSQTGQPLAEVEKDELMLIMSRKATAANADLIPSLLEASRKGERLPVMQRELPMPNPAKVGQAMRVVHMAQGGAVGAMEDDLGADRRRQARGTALVNLGEAPDDPITERIVSLLEQIAAESAATRAGVQNFPTELSATTSIREGERRMGEYNKIQRLNQARRA